MQVSPAYVAQIPAGLRPRAAVSVEEQPPSISPLSPGRPVAAVFVQIASLPSEAAAIRFATDFAARLGNQRPKSIKGVRAVVNGEPRIRLMAGPFTSGPEAMAFCRLAFATTTPCLWKAE